MKIILQIIISALCLSTFLVTGSISFATPQDRVRAQIGIQVKSGEHIARAKTKESLETGDLLRVYVVPEADAYVYVVHTDHKTATLLNKGQEKIQDSTLVLPSTTGFYWIDGTSPVETFTIICSPTELTEISVLLGSGKVSYAEWAPLEETLSKKSRIDLSQKPEKPFAIAGNVRGISETIRADPFFNELQIFSGESLLVKHYEFTVQK